MTSRESIRVALRLGALGVAVCTSTRVAAAQSASEVDLPNPRHTFEDSWYWGAKGGVQRFGTVVDGRVSAPLAGAEWLITHRRGALLVSAEQSFFDRASMIADPYTHDGVRTVASPLGLTDPPPATHRPPPGLDEHGAEIRSWLGKGQ